MLIQNFDWSYQVIRYLDGTDKTEELLCKELTKGEDTAWLLVRTSDPVVSKSFTLFLEEKVKKQEFTDYCECFQAEGAFCAVFRYSLEQSLKEKLKNELCSLKERIQIARGLLERLLILNPHPYFAWNALRPEQITVSRSLEVRWNYHLEKVGQFDSCSMKDVEKGLSSVMRLLFQREEQKHLYPLLEEYLQNLARGKETTYLELYQNFIPVCEELIKEPDKEQLPKTFAFRMWEKTKKILNICKYVMAVLIILAALLYVIHTFQDKSGDKVVSKTIYQIGDITIE